MPLHINKKEPQKPSKNKDYYKEWYAANRNRISIKRKKLYAENISYRDKLIGKARKYKELKKGVLPYEGPYIISFVKAAKELQITPNVLRAWYKKKYFPKLPLRGGSLWMTEFQFSFLERLRDFFDLWGPIVRKENKDEFEGLINHIHSNWDS